MHCTGSSETCREICRHSHYTVLLSVGMETVVIVAVVRAVVVNVVVAVVVAVVFSFYSGKT